MLRRKTGTPFSWDPEWLDDEDRELPQEWVEEYTQKFTYEQWCKIASNSIN